MSEFKRDDRVMVLAHFLGRDGDSGKKLVCVLARDGGYGRRLLFEPEELRPYPEQPAAHPLDAAVSELGRVTGLSGDDLLKAAEFAIHRAASDVYRAGENLLDAQRNADVQIRRAIGVTSPRLVEQAFEAVKADTPF